LTKPHTKDNIFISQDRGFALIGIVKGWNGGMME
jgi:hypothetical protein